METRTDTITLGDVAVTRVYEQQAVRLPRVYAFPDSADELWRANEDWLAPDFWDPETDELLAAMQTWVIRSQGRTILVDTGIGNGKDRPGMPIFSGLNTSYLDNLAAAGAHPEDVDLVVISHIHGDHVGWNTYWDGGEWVPTFPNARYLINKSDFDYWNPDNAHQTRSAPRMTNVFEDSVAPVHHAGQTVLWDDHYDLDANLRLELAPGHTPGSAVLTLRSGTDRAMFIGDLLHTPLQLAAPDESPCFDEDEALARATRRRVLEEVAEQNMLLLPAHLPGAGALEVQRAGSGYAVQAWAAFR